MNELTWAVDEVLTITTTELSSTLDQTGHPSWKHGLRSAGENLVQHDSVLLLLSSSCCCSREVSTERGFSSIKFTQTRSQPGDAVLRREMKILKMQFLVNFAIHWIGSSEDNNFHSFGEKHINWSTESFIVWGTNGRFARRKKSVDCWVWTMHEKQFSFIILWSQDDRQICFFLHSKPPVIQISATWQTPNGTWNWIGGELLTRWYYIEIEIEKSISLFIMNWRARMNEWKSTVASIFFCCWYIEKFHRYRRCFH